MAGWPPAMGAGSWDEASMGSPSLRMRSPRGLASVGRGGGRLVTGHRTVPALAEAKEMAMIVTTYYDDEVVRLRLAPDEIERGLALCGFGVLNGAIYECVEDVEAVETIAAKGCANLDTLGAEASRFWWETRILRAGGRHAR